MRANFIVLEGPDAAGTTTQSQLLAENLRRKGHDVVLTNEPTDNEIGKFIRQQLTAKTIPSPEALQMLFCADRALHVKTVIQPALKAGKIVITDRYMTSTLIYGAALGIDIKWLERLNVLFPKPDLEIFTLPGLENCLNRMQKRKEDDVFENIGFATTIYRLYEAMASQRNSVYIVDTSKEKTEAADHILQIVEGASVREY